MVFTDFVKSQIFCIGSGYMVSPSNLDYLISLQLRKLNLPSRLFQRKHSNDIYPDLALKSATSVCLSSWIRTYALDIQKQRPGLSLVARWAKYIPDGSTTQLKRIKWIL